MTVFVQHSEIQPLSLAAKTLIEKNYFFITQIITGRAVYITAVAVHSITNFIMYINSVYAVSIENMQGHLCVNIKKYLNNLFGKNLILFLLFMFLELQ